MMNNVSKNTLSECEKMRKKSLLEMMLQINNVFELSAVDNKKKTLSELNLLCGTHYNMNHFNNWLSQRKPTPEKIKSVLRKNIMQYLFGDDIAEMLTGIN